MQIAADCKILQDTNVSIHKTKYILQKKTSLQKKHNAKFISLQAANVSEPAYSKSYFAKLQNLKFCNPEIIKQGKQTGEILCEILY